MQYRRLGKTNLQVSVIGFGAIKLRGVEPSEATRALNRALDLGINFIDTARAYHDSEEKIGRALHGRREEYILATKTVERGAQAALAELETSLTNLRTDHVDLWQLHTVSTWSQWEQINAPDGAIAAGHKALEQGKILHFGITIHRDWRAMRAAIESGLFETIMLAYSPLDPEGVGPEILPLAQKHDLGVIIMKGLSGGQLAQPLETRKPGFGGADAIVAGSLRFILSNPAVTTVIPGITCVREVEENGAVGANFTPLTEDELTELRKLIGSQQKSYRYGQVCLRCGYCLPCPQGINIPEVLRAADMKRDYPDDLKYMGDALWESLEVYPEACVECRKCVEKCPGGLDIPAKLQEAAQQFVR
jgi:predicted aldo/keto reductase-like oxidoreductase